MNRTRISAAKSFRAHIDGHVAGVRLRPHDRVERYLRTEFDRPDLKDGGRLPTVRTLASTLKVSVHTVQQAFAKMAREGRIRTKVGDGTFLVSRRAQALEGFKLGLTLHLPRTSPGDEWTSRIGSGILQASMRAPHPIVLVPLAKDMEEATDLREKLWADLARVDGLLMFPSARTEGLQEDCERIGKWVVHLNPPSETATVNFVSVDYYGASFRLGEAWRRSGRRRILLIVGGTLSHSVSSRLRYAGLVNGLGVQLGEDITLRTVETAWGFEENGYQAAQQMLREKDWVPDAIYCAGDWQALGAARAMREKGLSVPRDVSVVGGTGITLANTACPQLTRLDQPCEKLGQELVAMMGQRIAQKGAPVPGRFLAAPFIGGATTRPEENAQLGIAPSKREPREMEES